MISKKYIIIIAILFLNYAQASEKNWFVDLGLGLAPLSISGTHKSMDTDNLQGIENNWEAMSRVYGEVGYSFLLRNGSHLLMAIGGDLLLTANPSNHSTFFAKASLLYPVSLSETHFNLGPKVKVHMPLISYYEDSDDGRFTRKVEYDTGVAFAVGIDAVWDVDKVQLVTGIEYLTSSNYEGKVKDSDGYANSSIDLDGVYLNLGIRYHF
ncbi:MAG: hypothetical protein L3J43_07895 [Sulfurovum sp.]|nr:hypothetical protein [Sulfurovum sp.]